MKARFAVWPSILLLATVACGASPLANHLSSPSPSVAQSPPGLECRLPVGGFMMPTAKGTPDPSVTATGLPNQHGMGGFVDLPSGKYTPAADSESAYDAAAHVWVPVQPAAISPDGSSYVEVRATGDASHTFQDASLYLVDARTKAARKLYQAPHREWLLVLGYTVAGVYAEAVTMDQAMTTTLLLVDPSSGATRQIARTSGSNTQPPWGWFSGDAVWGEALVPASTGQPAYRLVRLNLADGTSAGWYTSATGFAVAGFDGESHPILLVFSQQPPSIAVLTGPGQTSPLVPDGGEFKPSQGTGLTDAHGTWFGSADGSIWVYAGGKLKKVATVPPQTGATGQPYDPHAWRSIAGPCI